MTRIGAALVLAAAAAGCDGCSCAKVAGPEGEIETFLQAQREGGLVFQIAGKPLRLTSAKFDHVLVKPEGEGFIAVGKVDAEGVFDRDTKVSYIGLERVPFVLQGGRWVPRGAFLPGLEAVGALLEARREALEAHDAAALEKLLTRERLADQASLAALRERVAAESAGRRRAQAWIARVERDGAEVLEESAGLMPDGTLANTRVRLVLRREDGALKIADGN